MYFVLLHQLRWLQLLRKLLVMTNMELELLNHQRSRHTEQHSHPY